MSSSIIEKKLEEFYPGVIIRKDIRLDEIRLLPKYIQEWVVSRFIDTKGTEVDYKKLKSFIHERIPDRKEKEVFCARLMEDGILKVVSEFKALVDLEADMYIVESTILDLKMNVIRQIIRENQQLLVTGMWGAGTIINNSGVLQLAEFHPMQVASIDLNAFTEGRQEFTTEEWMKILLTSFGVNASQYSRRQQLIYLLRAVPLVESNVNLIELGPKQTGKTFLFRNSSSYSRVISGGSISPAQLFYNLLRNTPGILALNDLVAFDEINFLKFGESDELIGKLKDFMESGNYDRGEKKVQAQTSVIFIGNLPDKYRSQEKIGLSAGLPEIMRDTAFLDRIHGLIPGWELPKIGKSEHHLAQGLAFASDYLGNIMHQFRKLFHLDYPFEIKLSNIKIRDEKAIKRTFSGLMKLIYPDGNVTQNEVKEILGLAIEIRQHVLDEQTLMEPDEFPERKVKWEIYDKADTF